MSLRKTMVSNLKERRQRIIEGKVNSIPSPFPRFSDDFIGIEQATYYTVTSFTKGGKSQFSSFTFIYNALLFAYYHKETDIKVTIIYFALEETPERIMQRFTSYVLYMFTKGKIRISPRDLRSSKNDKPVPQEVLDKIDSKEVTELLDFFEDNIIFSSESNPTGIYKFCRDYAAKTGVETKKKYTVKNGFGLEEEREAFDYYTPNNPNEYVIPVIDTINIIDTEKGMTLKQSMDKLSEYLGKYLRNRYYFSPLVIQQQAFEQENNEAFKLNKVRPSVAGLGDSKYTSRDANVVLGLFSPARFGLVEYMGYDITKLKDNVRFLEVIVNRDGEMGGIIALYFDGAVCTFKEMPKPDDVEGLKKVYERIKLNKESDNTAIAMLSYSKTISKNNDKTLQKKNIFSTFAIQFKNKIKELWQKL